MVSQTCVCRYELRARSEADGHAMPSWVSPRAIEVMPRPATYSPKIHFTTGVVVDDGRVPQPCAGC